MKTILLNALIIMLAAIFFSSCYKDAFCTRGNGEIVTKTLSISNFTGIDFQEAGDVYISQGPEQIVTVTGDENIIRKLKENVHSGVWDIDLERGCYTDYDLTVNITVPNIDEIHLSGAGNIVLEDFVDQEDLKVTISGSGDIDLNEFEGADKLKVVISGSGKVYGNEAFENLEELDIKISGSGRLEAYPIQAKVCDITISGSGNTYVFVQDDLDVNISGSGSVHYKGYPNIDSNISGTGNIINEN